MINKYDIINQIKQLNQLMETNKNESLEYLAELFGGQNYDTTLFDFYYGDLGGTIRLINNKCVLQDSFDVYDYDIDKCHPAHESLTFEQIRELPEPDNNQRAKMTSIK